MWDIVLPWWIQILWACRLQNLFGSKSGCIHCGPYFIRCYLLQGTNNAWIYLDRDQVFLYMSKRKHCHLSWRSRDRLPFEVTCFYLWIRVGSSLVPKLISDSHLKWLTFFELNRRQFWVFCWVYLRTGYLKGIWLAFTFIRIQAFLFIIDG